MRRSPKILSPLDWLILFGLCSLAGYILYRLFFSLNYRWNWGIIPTYLVRFDEQQQRWAANALLQGFFTTIRLSCWGMLLAIPLGVVIGLMRISPRLAPQLTGRLYVEFIRNTPPLVLVFLFYYFVNDQILTRFAISHYREIRRLSARLSSSPATNTSRRFSQGGGHQPVGLSGRDRQGRHPVGADRPVGGLPLSGTVPNPGDASRHSPPGDPHHAAAAGQ
jgi:His/Glu/Gln/Arg/opine family amino acid ABC transporter permease subunit